MFVLQTCMTEQACVLSQLLLWVHQHSLLPGVCFHADCLEKDGCGDPVR